MRRRHGQANYRLVRYADDFLMLVSGNREHAERIRTDLVTILAPMGLRMSEEKTLITHIDDGPDFLGWHIQRHTKPGTTMRYVYTYPSRKAVKAVMEKVKTQCRNTDTSQPLDALLIQLDRMLPGWCAYVRPGLSHAAFQYLGSYTWARVIGWLRRRMVAIRPGTDAVRPGKGTHHALPLPGNRDPVALADRHGPPGADAGSCPASPADAAGMARTRYHGQQCCE
jgi:hypothetical protein